MHSVQRCRHFCFVGLLLLHFSFLFSILFYASVSYISPDAMGECKQQRAELVAFSPGTSNDPAVTAIELSNKVSGVSALNSLQQVTAFCSPETSASSLCCYLLQFCMVSKCLIMPSSNQAIHLHLMIWIRSSQDVPLPDLFFSLFNTTSLAVSTDQS